MDKSSVGTAISGVLSTIAAYAADKFGVLVPVMFFLLVLFCFDYLTAVIRGAILAKTHPENPKAGLNSKIGMTGILKKVGYLLSVGAAIMVDIAILFAAKYVGVTLQTKTFFGLLFACFWCLNEMISILENLDDMDIGMPKWLMKLVKILKTNLMKQGDDVVESAETYFDIDEGVFKHGSKNEVEKDLPNKKS